MKKETILQHELRCKMYTQTEAAKKLKAYPHIVSFWCSGRVRIMPKYIKGLREMGISDEAIEHPTKIWKEKI